MTNHRDLMQFHVQALFTHDADGDLVRVNEPHGPAAPRFFFGRTQHGSVLRFRHDVDAGIRRELEAAAAADLVPGRPIDDSLDASRYAAILERSAPVGTIWAGSAFSFPQGFSDGRGTLRITERNAGVLELYFYEWIDDVPRCQPMAGIQVNGHVVSLCCSVRQTDLADEAGVETAQPYRGHDYARHVTTAWATAVREQNRVPLYSTSWANAPSRAVARKIGLLLIGSDLHLG